MAMAHTGVMFTTDGNAEVLAFMEELAARGDGKGWMNLQPWVEDDERPNNSPLGRMFSARGPAIPLATWVPGHRRGRREVPATVGLAHVTGRFAVRRLAERGVELPAGWVVRQDHNRRGLVFELPGEASPEAVLRFLLMASDALSGVATDGRWMADVVVQGRHRDD